MLDKVKKTMCSFLNPQWTMLINQWQALEKKGKNSLFNPFLERKSVRPAEFIDKPLLLNSSGRLFMFRLNLFSCLFYFVILKAKTCLKMVFNSTKTSPGQTFPFGLKIANFFTFFPPLMCEIKWKIFLPTLSSCSAWMKKLSVCSIHKLLRVKKMFKGIYFIWTFPCFHIQLHGHRCKLILHSCRAYATDTYKSFLFCSQTRFNLISRNESKANCHWKNSIFDLPGGC